MRSVCGSHNNSSSALPALLQRKCGHRAAHIHRSLNSSPPYVPDLCTMEWAGLQGSAPASTRGLSLVSYNIGVRTDGMFSSEEKKPAFIKKLRQDLGDLCRDTDAICLQEISPAWKTQVLEIVPPEWTEYVFCPDATFLTLWNGNKLHNVTIGAETLKVFPAATPSGSAGASASQCVWSRRIRAASFWS